MRGATLLVLILLLAGPPALAGQQGLERVEQDRLLREAAVMEARGDHRGAEESLRTLLDSNPENATAVFALDRVLRTLDREDEMLPVVREHLASRPDSPRVRALELRLLARSGSLSELERAVEEWAELDPGSILPYQESARYLRALQGPERGLEIVDEARDRADRDDVLALEAGDFLAELGRYEEAVGEWVKTLGAPGRLNAVLRRIREIPGDLRGVVATLVDRIEERNPTDDERRAVARLALDAGANEVAVDVARRALEEMDERVRRGFLVQFATRAEDLGATSVALWALDRLRQTSLDSRELRALDDRMAELMLAAGDTTGALAAWERVNRSYPEGSVQKRRAVAASIEIELETLSTEDAAERLEEFRSEFPDAPELDALSGRVALGFLEAGEWERAQEVLAGVEGPRSALHRAYLEFQRDSLDAGLAELGSAQENVAPSEATEVLHLLTFLQRAQEDSAHLGGRVAALFHWGRVDEALELLDSEVDAVSLDDRPGLLALGARLAERSGREADAARLRERLLDEFPDAPETPEAAIRLARYLGGMEDRAEDARLILEELILSRPESAIVPEARRALQDLRSSAGRRNR